MYVRKLEKKKFILLGFCISEENIAHIFTVFELYIYPKLYHLHFSMEVGEYEIHLRKINQLLTGEHLHIVYDTTN